MRLEPRPGTPIYFKNTLYSQYISVLYDWHCILLCALEMMQIVQIDKNNRGDYNFYITVQNSKKLLYDINKDTFDRTISRGFLSDQPSQKLKRIIIENWFLYNIIRQSINKSTNQRQGFGFFDFFSPPKKEKLIILPEITNRLDIFTQMIRSD